MLFGNNSSPITWSVFTHFSVVKWSKTAPEHNKNTCMNSTEGEEIISTDRIPEISSRIDY